MGYWILPVRRRLSSTSRESSSGFIKAPLACRGATTGFPLAAFRAASARGGEAENASPPNVAFEVRTATSVCLPWVE
jgi:hypothetical protein